MYRNSKSAGLLRILAESYFTQYEESYLKKRGKFSTITSLKQTLGKLKKAGLIFYDFDEHEETYKIYADLRNAGKEAVKKIFRNTVHIKEKIP